MQKASKEAKNALPPPSKPPSQGSYTQHAIVIYEYRPLFWVQKLALHKYSTQTSSIFHTLSGETE